MFAGFDPVRSRAITQSRVGIDDRLQTMGDDEGRAAEPEVVERLLHLLLANFRNQCRSRLVEQQDRRVLQDRARDRDALALSPGEPAACSPTLVA